MKMYLNVEQTAKLIELGFEKPKNQIKAEQAGDCAWYNPAYSIGELISFIPDSGNENWGDLQIIRTGVCYYSRRMIYNFDDEPELIDNLFNICVKLKEEGEI